MNSSAPATKASAVLHFSQTAAGGAGRAARRASLACAADGMSSQFVHVDGSAKGSARLVVGDAGKPGERGRLARALTERIQKEFIPDRRTPLTNTLFSIAYPGADVSRHRLFETADILHLHWTSWGVTPTTIARWLGQGRTLFWTLHDLWPFTGGCHYPAGCDQHRSLCLDCPQLRDDHGLVANSFAEKKQAYGRGGSLRILAPTRWLADLAGRSAIFGERRIDVVRNPIELDVFAPRADRDALRRAFGFDERDLVLMLGGFDLAEQRKGVQILLEALQSAAAEGILAESLSPGATINVIVVGKGANLEIGDGVNVVALGALDDDSVLADVLCLADLTLAPSLEDNYPNLVLESLACGTPALGFDVGGLSEMIAPGRTGLFASPVGSPVALREALVEFSRRHFGSQSMRAACRAAVEADNDPRKIGRQLRALYEEALGRPLAGGDPSVEARMFAAFRATPVAPDETPGADFFAFPFNHALRARIVDAGVQRGRWGADLSTREERDPRRTRMLALRVDHDHHAEHSGPAQFLRYLPSDAYETRSWATPLNSTLLTGSDDLFRRAGALMGAPAFGRQGNGWMADTEALVRCAAGDVDLVHFIDADISGVLAPRAAARLFRGDRQPAMVATFHQPPSELARSINPGLLRRFDGIVALCESQRRFLAPHIDAARLRIIPHGVDTDFFHPSAQRIETSPSAGLRLLMVGHWLRDTPAALATLAILRARGVEAELTLISPDPAANMSDPTVRRLGRLSDEELRCAYWDADLLLLPLTDATANNAILEAMACGLPVVTTDVGGVAETLGAHAGVLCPPGDPAALAEAVGALAAAPERRAEMGRAGRGRAETLSWRRIAALHHDFYQTIVEMRAATAREEAHL